MGKLIIVPTPIGNLEDITLRALRVLKEADLIFAEDTRTTGVLLRHYGIAGKLSPFHMHNEHRLLDSVMQKIASSSSAALVSDAGTPGISDAGFLLVRRCIEEGIPVECLPGPTALIPALVCSGLPADKFCFEGFLPHKKGRQGALSNLSGETRSMVFYESPHRLLKTLREMAAHFGEGRPCSVSRELTKKFEETFRGTLKEASAYFTAHAPRGEFVIVVKGKGKDL